MLSDATDIALQVVKETDAGIVVNGARVLATLPIADENRRLSGAVSPVAGRGGGHYLLRFCHTLTARRALSSSAAKALISPGPVLTIPSDRGFEEMDALAFFDNVFVPWERVFLLGDPDRCNSMARGD